MPTSSASSTPPSAPASDVGPTGSARSPAASALRRFPTPAGAHLPAILPMPSGSTARAARVIESFVAAAQRTHEVPTPSVEQTVLGGWPSPLAAARGFAATYINWSWTTLAGRLRLLAAASVGQARSAMALAAADAANDYELRRGEISNSGTVEAVGQVAGHPGEYAVVTLERTTAAASSAYEGLQPAWHVSLASVTPVQDGLWVLSSWQPES